MYHNKWTVVDALSMSASDVWLVPEQSYASLTGNTIPISAQEPVLLVDHASRPMVLIPKRSTTRKLQTAFRDAAKLSTSLKPRTVGITIDGLVGSQIPAALWGVGQGLYQYRNLSEDTVGPDVLVSQTQQGSELRSFMAVLQAQSLVRDWVNLPSNLKPPQTLATIMREQSSPGIEWQLLDQRMLKDLGAGGILGVGQGSHRPPVMLVGRYQGAPGRPWLALVGKGITFDSGGISLKPGDGMGRMKGDMAGAAAVAAAIRTVAHLEMQVNVMAIAPLAENLPGGGAYRPGDVLTMMDGTTVEVISTDAEGRLVLGDGITYAVRQNVAAVVDIATLTGANVVALGGIRSALLSNNSALRDLVVESSDFMAEPTWELPHDDDYRDFNKTTAATIKNSGGRPAGTITAGLFVGHFAHNTPWAHLDIAGLAFESGAGIGAGVTGFGVATLVELCRRFGDRPLHDASNH